MSETLIALVATECRYEVERVKKEGGGVPEMAAAAFPKAKNHWMVLDEDTQFKGAVAAIYEAAEPEDQERIKHELETLRNLAAAMAGVPVDWSAMERSEDAPKAFGLAGIWRDA